MFEAKQSTALTVPFFAHDANGDGVTGVADGSWTKRISKNGGAFGAMTVTVTEMENGWYSIPLSSSHTDTTGLLAISLSSGSTKRVNMLVRVSARLVDDVATQTSVDTIDDFLDTEIAAIKTKTDYLPSATAGAPGGLFIAGSNAATTVNITGNITGNLSGSVGSVTGAVGSVTAAVSVDAASVRTAVGMASANLDTQLTAIDDYLDSEVAAIKAKTDSLTFTVAGVVDANIQRINDVTITGNGQTGTEFGV